LRALHRLTAIHLLPFSFFGLILIAVLTDLPPTIHDDASWRKPLTGAVFSVVLTAGILAGVFPSTCSGKFHFRSLQRKERLQEQTSSSSQAPGFHGHHPTCGHFSDHVLQAGRVSVCAGCAGLVSGAAISLAGVAWYFFLNASLGPTHPVVFWAGFIGVACGLFQYHLFNWGGSCVHLLANVYFVLGAFLLLAGVDALTQSLVLDVYVIVLSVFWLYTRILLSQSHHRGVCTACGKEPCRYR
jgi:hypothetical protein